MPPDETIAALLAAAIARAEENARAADRAAARTAWAKDIPARLAAANKRADAAWMRAIDALPEDHTDEELEAIPEPPEQAELDAIHAQIRNVIDHDRWPRHLHWGNL